jgi:LAO/AO transport system kinase
VDVAAATDTTLVVLAPGLGDAVQMAKAGILEVADVFVVNKADRDGAAEVARELRQMLHLGAERAYDPPIVKATASLGEGVDLVWAAIREHGAWSDASGARDAKRRARLLAEVESLAAERFRVATAAALEADPDLAADLAERRVDPYGAAAALARRASP